MSEELPTTSAVSQAGARPDTLADELRGFGPAGLLAMAAILLTGNIEVAPMLFLPVGALLVLAWVRLSRTPWRAIGYVRPRSWVRTVVAGILLGATLKVAIKSLVLPPLGADPVNHAYHFLTGNRALLPAATFAMLNAGFAEETMFRGYLFERLGRVLGSSGWAKAAIVLITSVWFGLGHLSRQGVPGAEQALITGLVFGTLMAVRGRIWVLIVAHAAFDLTALAIIYWDLEPRVAHFFFK